MSQNEQVLTKSFPLRPPARLIASAVGVGGGFIFYALDILRGWNFQPAAASALWLFICGFAGFIAADFHREYGEKVSASWAAAFLMAWTGLIGIWLCFASLPLL